jgi:hypothetical protein
MRLVVILLAAYLVCPLAVGAGASSSINLSRDLVSLGIAGQNLSPNDPSLDARPLFEAALKYVRGHRVRTLTLDRGAYYFLTAQSSTAYIGIYGFSDLTVDLAGSTIYFADAFKQGFGIAASKRVTLKNFQIDFLKPPYTYVKLASVNPAQRTLAYTLSGDWPDPATFNGGMSANGPLVLWAVAFRNGEILPGTSRMHIAEPVAGNVLQLVQDHTPWTQSATLSTLQPDDVIVVTQRGGPPPIIASNSDSVSISRGTVFGSSGMAVLLDSVSNSSVDSVYVQPRPGNLLSTNADGIHFVNTGPDNHIRKCFVTGTLDDALAMDSYLLATVVSQNSPRQLTVIRTAYLHFPNGSSVNFVDPVSADEFTGATIVSQNPPDSNSPVFDGTVILNFDHDLPAINPGSEMVFSGPASRGAGSSIENNIVEEVPFGRGIWIGGAKGIVIQGNSIGHTSNGGIAICGDTAPNYPTPPAHHILVRRNLVYGSLGPMASGSGTQIAVGAILVNFLNNRYSFVPDPRSTNISIEDNLIIDSGRSGIWVGELDGGTVRDNVIIGYDKHPELPLFGVGAAERTQLLQDFTQPIVVHYSNNVTVANNQTAN